MDFSKSYLNALKSTGNPLLIKKKTTGNPSSPQSPSFPAPPQSSQISSLPESRPPSFPAPPQSSHISSLPESRPPSFPAPPQSSHISSPPEYRPPSFPAPPQSSHISSLPESRLPNIPPDLITEILSRIPIKSLLRFRCVCKSWHNLISDPQFSLSFQNQKLAIRCGEGLYDLILLTKSVTVSKAELCYPMGKKEIGGAEEVWMPRLEILGSCKCFLLIKRDVNLYLCNPSIRQCTKVLSLPQPDYNVESERRLTGSGLCYDSSTDDYKAILACKGDYSYRRKNYEGFIVVASLKSRRWKSFCLPYKLRPVAVAVNERLHWVVKTGYEDGMRSQPQQIVCFDPLVEEFAEFPTPYNSGSNIMLGLGVLDGCLSALRSFTFESGHYRYEDKYEVLIMKKYGVEESWTSLFAISKFPWWSLSRHDGCGSYKYGCLVPLCFIKSGKLVIVVNGGQMALYDPVKESWKCGTSLTNVFAYQTNVFAYDESLVSTDSYGGKNDWRIERVWMPGIFVLMEPYYDIDSWSLSRASSDDVNSLSESCDYGPSWDDMNYFWEQDDDMMYDLEEEEYYLKIEKLHRMKIKTKNRW